MVLLNNVTRILELAVPLMEHPSESFLAQLEEDMMKLILKHGMMVGVHRVAISDLITVRYVLHVDIIDMVCFQCLLNLTLKRPATAIKLVIVERPTSSIVIGVFSFLLRYSLLIMMIGPDVKCSNIE